MSRPPRGRHSRARRHWLPAALFGLLLSLVAVPSALADSTQSANWGGYAVHRSGVRFDKVIASWRQPNAVCTQDQPTYSSIWVGLGGYNLGARALEQIGSEVDCSASGQVVSSAWYELVPAPSKTIHMTVAPGDALTASVVVTGHRVSLMLRDLTRHTSFARKLTAKQVDVSSAEWIVEAPSECAGATQCQTLSLADFGSASFSHASATPISGHTGSLTDKRWQLTKIILSAGQRHFISGSPPQAQATPSSLRARGSAFTVDYRAASGGSSPTANTTRRARVSAAVRLRPGGTRFR